MKDEKFKQGRLPSEPHYFGCGEIGQVVNDPLSTKNDLFVVTKTYI
ncbi:hypothetical protein ACFLVJ_02375 [Chloroflexota bacterium]